MNKLFYLFLLFIHSLPISSQSDYQIVGSVADKKAMIIDEILYLNDSCTFKIVDSNGNTPQLQSSKWLFAIKGVGDLAKPDEEEEISMNCSLDNSEFGIKIDSIMYEDVIFSRLFKRYQFKDNRSIYYSGFIEFKGTIQGNDKEITLQFPFWINLLPEIPLVTIKHIEWGTYNEETLCFENAYMDIQVTSERADYIYITYPDPVPSKYPLVKGFISKIISQENINRIEFSDKDTYYYFQAKNKNGTYYSPDTIFIKELFTSNNYPDIKEKEVTFYPNPVNYFLYLNNNIDDIKNISVNNIEGNQLLFFNQYITTGIDLSSLQTGVYILSFEQHNSKKRTSIKLIKK